MDDSTDKSSATIHKRMRKGKKRKRSGMGRRKRRNSMGRTKRRRASDHSEERGTSPAHSNTACLYAPFVFTVNEDLNAIVASRGAAFC